MRKHLAAPSVPENHNMEKQNPKKPTKSQYIGNLLIVGVFLGVFVSVGVSKPSSLIEKFEPKMNPWNIINNISGIYNA